ncbi:hypothetical protein [Actinomadura sp. 7K507]|uniref:hypothetical protein n=1 Tax=Actinomadura sp. 7K507 TaxID=2530365 RepID=UPI001A9F8F19|nr:hypothetical protein [Actinomadura sp. 7K507]
MYERHPFLSRALERLASDDQAHAAGRVARPLARLRPKEEALLADGLHRTLDAREHRLFSGVFGREHIPLAGHLVCKLLGIRYGDYRDRPGIDAWASSIARELASGRSAPAHGAGPPEPSHRPVT